MLTNNLALRAEVLYVNLGDQSLDVELNQSLNDETKRSGVVELAFTRQSAALNELIVSTRFVTGRIGLTYTF